MISGVYKVVIEVGVRFCREVYRMGFRFFKEDSRFSEFRMVSL